MEPGLKREESALAAGRFGLDHSDVLVVVWDGQSVPEQGGTAELVAEARQRGLPLVWVQTGDRQPGTLNTASPGEEQGKVTCENLF